MTTKKLERLGNRLRNEKLSGEVSTPKNHLLNELDEICSEMIDLLNEREAKKAEDINYINGLGALASYHLITPLFYFCELTRFLNEKEWERVANYWLKDTILYDLYKGFKKWK